MPSATCGCFPGVTRWITREERARGRTTTMIWSVRSVKLQFFMQKANHQNQRSLQFTLFYKRYFYRCTLQTRRLMPYRTNSEKRPGQGALAVKSSVSYHSNDLHSNNSNTSYPNHKQTVSSFRSKLKLFLNTEDFNV